LPAKIFHSQGLKENFVTGGREHFVQWNGNENCCQMKVMPGFFFLYFIHISFSECVWNCVCVHVSLVSAIAIEEKQTRHCICPSLPSASHFVLKLDTFPFNGKCQRLLATPQPFPFLAAPFVEHW